MNLIALLLFGCLAVELCAQSDNPEKPLTYQAAKAANRPPTKDAAKAMGAYAAEAAKQCALQISFGRTDPQVIRDAVVLILKPQEEQLRATLKAAGWTEEQVEITVVEFEDRFLDLTSIAKDVPAQR